MNNKINDIIIVGGGSAGWMAAATLIKVFPNKNITLIESANTPTVGVGESTLGSINNWLAMLEIDEKDFIPHTDASLKLSIRFQNFHLNNNQHFHYPFGQPDTRASHAGTNDWLFKKFLKPDTPNSNYAESWYPCMALVNQNKYFDNKLGHLVGWDPKQDVAYHFDATKFGLWLKTHYCLPRGVKYIVADVTDTKVTNNGLEEIILDGQISKKADLFIDCTGFKSMLLGGALKEPFNSLEHMLPNNSAVATKVPYVNKQKQLVPYTNCVAYENGWIWEIPIWSRMGTGYVYSDKYISDEKAILDFKRYLKSKNVRDIESLEFKTIKMRTGLHERLWVKNVCGIGLAAGFIEPLESNGLFTVHEFLRKLVRILKRDRVNRTDKDFFNYACKKQFNEFAEFVAMHYAFSHRTDTQYWRDIQERDFSSSLTKLTPTIIEGFQSAARQKMNDFIWQNAHYGGLHCIATGMGNYSTDFETISAELMEADIEFFRPGWEKTIKTFEDRNKLWKKVVDEEAQPLYSYLRERYHSNDI